jgi:hypothetical protein
MPRVELFESVIWKDKAWRMVEAQHIASTMKLVDDREEQDLLEELLEQSKPALPDVASELDYLLATPFRYPARANGSRFRAPTDPGVFYGAESERTAGAELGYWRWRFLMDSPSLERLAPNAHTAFRTAIMASAIDIRADRYRRKLGRWMHRADYSASQTLAREARKQQIEAIVYPSVRDPERGWCVALLTPTGFASARHDPATHTWFLTVTRRQVIWRRDSGAMTFTAERWLTQQP